jgi:hypothetical protein
VCVSAQSHANCQPVSSSCSWVFAVRVLCVTLASSWWRWQLQCLPRRWMILDIALVLPPKVAVTQRFVRVTSTLRVAYMAYSCAGLSGTLKGRTSFLLGTPPCVHERHSPEPRAKRQRSFTERMFIPDFSAFILCTSRGENTYRIHRKAGREENILEGNRRWWDNVKTDLK